MLRPVIHIIRLVMLVLFLAVADATRGLRGTGLCQSDLAGRARKIGRL